MLDPNLSPQHAKKSIIALLLELKDADKKENIQEIGYILHVALQLGLNEADVTDVDRNRDQYPFSPPPEEKDRVMILYYFLFFLSADGEIDAAEERMVQEMGFKLGFRPELTEALINVIKEHSNQSVPPEKLLGKIRAYLN